VSLADVLVWVLRLVGALYVFAGLFAARQVWFWARLSPDIRRLAQTLEQFSAEMGERNQPAQELAREDAGRPWWIFTGLCIVIAAGVAMMFAHRLAVPLLAGAVGHQMVYLVRQRRRELRAATPAEAADARAEPSTVNAFFLLLTMTVLAAWLYYEGALR
jgi:hypothetical protein